VFSRRHQHLDHNISITKGWPLFSGNKSLQAQYDPPPAFYNNTILTFMNIKLHEVHHRSLPNSPVSPNSNFLLAPQNFNMGRHEKSTEFPQLSGLGLYAAKIVGDGMYFPLDFSINFCSGNHFG